MSLIVHNVDVPDSGLGDALRTGFVNQNTMNSELYLTAVFKAAGYDLSKNDLTDLLLAKLQNLNVNAEVNVKANYAELDPTSDAYILNKPIFASSDITVSAIWTGSGLIFNVIADAFPINGVSYPATPATVTLDASSATLDRIDLIVAIKPTSPATIGTVGKITGTPASASLVVPPDYDPSLYYVIKQISVKAAATIPEGAVNTLVFDEGAEWTPALTSNLVINTSDPSVGVNCIEATNSTDSDSASFTGPAPLSTSNLDLLEFDLKLKEAVIGRSIYISLYLAGVLVDKFIFSSPTGLFDDTNLGYQTISLSKSVLNFPIASYDKIVIRPFWASTGYYLDNVRIFAGSGSEITPDNPVQDQKVPFNDYGTITEFLTDQGNQKKGFSVFDENNSFIYVYKGVANGLISDYWQLGTGTGQLEKITEGGNTGYILKGDNRANKGNIGPLAVDISEATTPSTTYGATGPRAFASGINTRASSANSSATGQFTQATAHQAQAQGTFTVASATNAIATGQQSIASASNSNAGGLANFARSEGEQSGGVFGTDYTPTGTSTDRLVNHGNGSNLNTKSDAYTLFKNGMQKLFTAALSTITNASKGSVMLDQNAVMNIHDGTTFKAVAFTSDIKPPFFAYASEAAIFADQTNQTTGYAYYVLALDGQYIYLGTTNGDATDYKIFGAASGGASYIQMYNQTRWTIPSDGNFAGINDSTGYTAGNAIQNTGESVAVNFVENSLAVIIGYSDFAYKLEKIMVAGNLMVNSQQVQLVVGYRDIRSTVFFNGNSPNPVVLHTENINYGSGVYQTFNKIVTFSTPLDIPADKEIVIGYKCTIFDGTPANVDMWHCGTTLTLKKV